MVNELMQGKSIYNAFVSVFHASHNINKEIRLGKDGKIIKKSGGQMGKGLIVEQNFTSLHELEANLVTLQKYKAVAWGRAKNLNDGKARISSKKNITDSIGKDGKPIISRTKENFCFNDGHSIFLLDYDSDNEAIKADELISILFSVCPILKDAPMIARPSGSTYIFNTATNKYIIENKGIRILIMLENGNDTKRFGDTLFKRLWLAGYGYIFISKAGSMLERTIIDNSVWQPERLDYVAGACCKHPLTRRIPTDATKILNDGNKPFNSLDFPSLSEDEEKKYDAVVTQAKEASKEKAEAQKLIWLQSNVKKDVEVIEKKEGRKATDHEKKSIEKKYRQAQEKSFLTPDFVLYHEKGSVTVGEILENPEAWNHRTFADPLEPDYNNSFTTAKAFLLQANPHINSFAHGGRKYKLVNKMQEQEQEQEQGQDFDIIPENEEIESVTNQSKVHEIIEETETTTETTESSISTATKKNIKDALRLNHDVILLHSATGTGKTTIVCKEFCNDNGHFFGQKMTFVCADIPAVDNVLALCKRELAGDSYEVLDVAISETINQENQEKISGKKRSLKQIVITTSAYLDFMGECGDLYAISKELFNENRIVVCDEIQELWNRIKIAYPIACNYLLNSDGEKKTYKAFSRCPKTSRKGDCKTCALGFSRESAEGTPKKRDFFKGIEQKFFDGNEKPKLPIFADCTNPQKYINVISGLCYFSLPGIEQTSLSIDDLYRKDKIQCNYSEWLELRIKYLINPHLRIVFPYIGSHDSPDKQILSREQVKTLEETGINYPIQACSIPQLSGISTVPILQLLKAKKLILMSATIPKGLERTFKEVCAAQHKSIVSVKINEIPFTFDMTILKTSERLSLEKQANLIKQIKQEKLFCVTGNKQETPVLHNLLRRIEGVTLYYGQNCEQLASYRSKQDSCKNIILTYARSPITRGANFPEICVALVDCNQFLPQIALDQINPLLTKEEINSLLVEGVKENLEQILGRFLRSKEQKEQGKTVQDKRKIVVLLHGLPDELQDFKPPIELLHTYTEYKNKEFFSSIPRLEIESLVKAIELARSGEKIPDRKKIDHDYVLTLAIEKGLENIDAKERALLTQDDRMKLKKASDEAKETKKAENIENKLKELKDSGLPWFKAYKKLNLDRFTKKEIFELKSLYKKI